MRPVTIGLVSKMLPGLALASALLVSASRGTGAQTPAATAPQSGPGSANAVVAYEGGRIITGANGTAIESGTMVVNGTRIVQVGPSRQVRVPAGAIHVNLSGKTLMPAIVDTHTHLASTRDALLDQLRGKAYYGVSATMSLGQDTGDVPFQVRDEIIPGAARFRTAGRGITAPEPGRTEIPYWIATADEARKAVQELAARKVDIVKIWVDDRDGKFRKLTPELYGAVIDEAHKHGLRVTAHLFTLEDAKGLLRAGVDAFAHGVRDTDIDDEFLALVKQRRELVLVPNLPDRGVKADFGWLRDSLPAAELAKLQAASTDNPVAQRAFGIQARNLAKMNAAGVKIALGTDGSVLWSHHLEMADMVAAGMTPAQVLVASTRTAAEFLRVTDTGTLEVGKSADFLVLDGNPLVDITNTRTLSAVFLRGAPVDRAAQRSRWMQRAPTE
jgi:imidazolonepropionase-like amidohydrolase